jgi:hypothetical protein
MAYFAKAWLEITISYMNASAANPADEVQSFFCSINE